MDIKVEDEECTRTNPAIEVVDVKEEPLDSDSDCDFVPNSSDFKVYNEFYDYLKKNAVVTITEKVVLDYYKKLSVTIDVPGLLSNYESLKLMLRSSENINLDDYTSVSGYFKWRRLARPAPIGPVLPKEQIHEFTVSVPDEHLAAKRKRCRSQNWDDVEKSFFLEYIREELDVIENKKKLTSCNREKKGAWKRISAKLELKGYSRDAKRLKEQWQRMKLQARRNINAFKKRYNLIGAGPPPTEPTDMDWKIIDLIPHEFMDDRNEFDSDTTLMPEVILDTGNEPSTTGDIYRTHQNTPIAESPDISDNEEITILCDTSTSLMNAKQKSMSLYEEKMLCLNQERIQQAMKHELEIHRMKMERERMITKYKEELFKLRKAHEQELHEEKIKLSKNKR